jgi:hypothetical protein
MVGVLPSPGKWAGNPFRPAMRLLLKPFPLSSCAGCASANAHVLCTVPEWAALLAALLVES